jgi:beta-glucosidase/6-phospho-beta-glucosidase/beta-galactosidase
MKPIKREPGTCDYPEHWPDDIWETDAKQMVELGLKWVRIGAFAWSRLEPKKSKFCFEWLDWAIEILGKASLSVILGPPTREGTGVIYLGSMLDHEGLNAFYQKLFKEIELDYLLMPAGVRRRCTDSEDFG